MYKGKNIFHILLVLLGMQPARTLGAVVDENDFSFKAKGSYSSSQPQSNEQHQVDMVVDPEGFSFIQRQSTMAKATDKDCKVAEWGKWGECTKTCASKPGEVAGKKIRQRHVEPLNCARSFEEMECPNDPCPVDCQMSDWEEWGACDKECENEGAKRNRTRTITQQPQHGGLCCPETKECSDKSEPNCGPTLTVEHEPCGAKKQRCEPSLWSEWSPCSQTCNTGKTSRARTIKTPAKCGGAPCLCDFLEIKNCKAKSCKQECELSSWNEWSECPVTCGGSIQTRQRKVVKPPAAGAPNCDALTESKNCAESCCEQDCVLSSWEPWSFCSASCYGTQKRTRAVEVTPCGTGRACEALFESRSCNHDCVLPCEVGEWGPWSECSATCGGGSQTRERLVTQQKANGGKNCPPLWEVSCCDESNVACESSAPQGDAPGDHQFEISIGSSHSPGGPSNTPETIPDISIGSSHSPGPSDTAETIPEIPIIGSSHSPGPSDTAETIPEIPIIGSSHSPGPSATPESCGDDELCKIKERAQKRIAKSQARKERKEKRKATR